ncbi:hypothetical protein ACFL50_00600 [Candidatus Latescibacterota bacterium]
MSRAIRKKYIIKRNLQLRFFYENAVFMFFVAMVTGFSVYIGLLKAIIFDLSGEKLTLINQYISFRMLIWFLPTVFAITVFSVFLSHQIAGPIFVFQRAINKMLNNEPVEQIRLRRNDKLKDFTEDLNKLIARYNTEGKI